MMDKDSIRSSKEKKDEEEATKQLYAFVLAEMKAGADQALIAQRLKERGVEEADAVKLAEAVYADISRKAQAEQLTVGSLVPALVGGLIAAAVGGGIWGLIVAVTDYEIGYAAWGIGLISGFLVLLFSRGRKGVPLQVIAVLSSLLGIAIGKYMAFYFLLKEALAQEVGAESARTLALFSERLYRAFMDNLDWSFSFYDFLWVGLAVFTAWRIPKGLGLKLPKSQPGKGFLVR